MTVLGVLELVTVEERTAAEVGPAFDGGRRWEITGPTVIGRSAVADVTLALPALSRQHVELVAVAGRLAVRDLGSRNGTAINGRPIGDEPVTLVDGDELVLGGSVALRFTDPMATPIRPRLGRLHGVWIDPDTDVVWLDARPLDPPLSPRQLALLRLLHDAEGDVVSRQRIVEAVWSDAEAEGVSDEAVAALIKRLRQRLADAGGTEQVEVVRHRGLRLRID